MKNLNEMGGIYEVLKVMILFWKGNSDEIKLN